MLTAEAATERERAAVAAKEAAEAATTAALAFAQAATTDAQQAIRKAAEAVTSAAAAASSKLQAQLDEFLRMLQVRGGAQVSHTCLPQHARLHLQALTVQKGSLHPFAYRITCAGLAQRDIVASC